MATGCSGGASDPQARALTGRTGPAGITRGTAALTGMNNPGTALARDRAHEPRANRAEGLDCLLETHP